MDRSTKGFLKIALLALFVIITNTSWADDSQICFHSDASGELTIREDRLTFEKADSGNVLVKAWVIRKQGRMETIEHWQFSFRLPILGRILSSQANFEQSFFPYSVSHGKLYQALLRACVRRNLFPRAIVESSALLRG